MEEHFIEGGNDFQNLDAIIGKEFRYRSVRAWGIWKRFRSDLVFLMATVDLRVNSYRAIQVYDCDRGRTVKTPGSSSLCELQPGMHLHYVRRR